MSEALPRLTSRLHFIQFCPDGLKNIEIWHQLSVFEDYVYGVISQFRRIKENLEEMKPPFAHPSSEYSSSQVRLDIYYYILTWDKLREIFRKITDSITNVQRIQNSIPIDFKNEFRQLRKRIEHLLAEFNKDVRNEYEHPSLEPRKMGGIVEWGSLFEDRDGNISVHVGKQLFAIVRKKHIYKLKSLWILLIDIFIKHFTDRPPSSALLQLRKQTEENVDLFICEYLQYRREKKNEEANRILYQFTMLEIHLSREGVPLNNDAKDRFYSGIFRTKSEH